MFRSILVAFKKMMDTQSVVQALQEAELFRKKHGDFFLRTGAANGDGPKDKPR
jgi:hypothetical protein